ncbi:MAG: phytanoyl-CoA dioxygenase family protein [Gammaproteobacteria bacterium]|nr:phytanoyl-CoA dioxygenase family protein [Gammaproteobacteria bacterium]MYJ75112.1 phytanoyl-CoA dioxygenase family protein [Gammaproteobacteria bacterium]
MSETAQVIRQPTAREHAASMADYIHHGERRAREMGNRGPIRFKDGYALADEILEAYWEHGFYVFENAIAADEIAELRADTKRMLERAPVGRGAAVDALGRPALGRGFKRPAFTFIKPLSDPVGGTNQLGGRHPSKMVEPDPGEGAPEEVVHMAYGMCQHMESGLRLYGHPKLLAIAENINGPDFTPFNDAIFIKQPGLGGSVAWHQDGITHWQSPTWNEGIHGFNFQVQLYPTTPGNCLWVMPGTHKTGRLDIKAMVEENGGSERLPGAVPLLCKPGDVTMVNRQTLHCSFANTSPDLRISLTFGFHRRASVLGAKGGLGSEETAVYDEQRIFDRSAVIAVAIDARRQRFPEEAPYRYQPFAGLEDDFRWSPETYERVIRDYNTKDLGI